MRVKEQENTGTDTESLKSEDTIKHADAIIPLQSTEKNIAHH